MSSSSSPSLTGRAILAVLLLVGFYVLAIGIVLGLLYILYAMVAFGNRINVRAAFFILLGVGTILWSIFPRRDVFADPGPELKPEEAPKLFREIEDIAKATDQDMPAQVFVVPAVNAFVADRGSRMGIGGQRIMGIGLPLLQTLTVSQFRAVLAHEFGHYYGGDTKLGPWLYKTRATIGRTVVNLSQQGSLLRAPFLWYGNLFLRVTNSVSRQQEFAADALASRVVGSRALVEGLKRIHVVGFAYEVYQQTTVNPVLNSGYYPPLSEGFATYLDIEGVKKFVGEATDKAMTESKSNPYDTHPTLQNRIEAVAGQPEGAMLAEDPLAISLLDNVPALEGRIFSHLAQMHGVSGLKPVAWEEIGEKVHIPGWRAFVENMSGVLLGLTVGSLPDVARDLNRLTLMVPPQAGNVDKKAIVRSLLGAALMVTLYDAGWTLHSRMSEENYLEKEGMTIYPFRVIKELEEGQMTAEAWAEMCEAGGFGALSLRGEKE